MWKFISFFKGKVYSKTLTMTDDSLARFESEVKKLRDVVIIVETYAMKLGKIGAIVYPVGANDIVGLTKVDISTLYFENATAGENGKISVLGVEE